MASSGSSIISSFDIGSPSFVGFAMHAGRDDAQGIAHVPREERAGTAGAAPVGMDAPGVLASIPRLPAQCAEGPQGLLGLALPVGPVLTAAGSALSVHPDREGLLHEAEELEVVAHPQSSSRSPY